MNLASFAETSATFPWFSPWVHFCWAPASAASSTSSSTASRKTNRLSRPVPTAAAANPSRSPTTFPFSRGWRCAVARCCGRTFSVRYPFVELLTGLLFVACWLRFSPGGAFNPGIAAAGWLFISCLIAATFIDLDHLIIPDVFTLGLGVVGVLVSFAVPALHGQYEGLFIVDSFRSGVASVVGLLVGSGLVLWIALLAEVILKKKPWASET